jgi:hypothetical protein
MPSRCELLWPVCDDETAVDVFGPKVAGRLVDQGLRRHTPVGRGLRGAEFCDVPANTDEDEKAGYIA